MNALIIFLCTFVLIATANAGGIKKWVDTDGNTHFGDSPPAEQATKRVIVNDTRIGNGSMVGKKAAAWVDGRKRSQQTQNRSGSAKDDSRDYGERMRYRNAAAGGDVLVGMSTSEVKRAWGEPTKIDRTTNNYGIREWWSYWHEDKPTEYVLLKNGKVTSVKKTLIK